MSWNERRTQELLPVSGSSETIYRMVKNISCDTGDWGPVTGDWGLASASKTKSVICPPCDVKCATFVFTGALHL